MSDPKKGNVSRPKYLIPDGRKPARVVGAEARAGAFRDREAEIRSGVKACLQQFAPGAIAEEAVREFVRAGFVPDARLAEVEEAIKHHQKRGDVSGDAVGYKWIGK